MKWILFFLSLTPLSSTYGADYSSPGSAGPAASSSGGLARALNGGIVYPSLYGSIQGNPAGLVADQKTVLQLEWDPSSKVFPQGAFTEGFAYGSSIFGFGANIVTATQGRNLAVNRSTLAAAVGGNGFAFGLNSSWDFANGTGADVSTGLSVANISGIQITILLTSIQSFKTVGALNFGLGIARPKKYQIEGSWSYTLFSQLQQNILSVSAIGYLGIFGLGVNGSSTTNVNGNSFTAGLAGIVNVTSRVLVGLRTLYDTSEGTRFTISTTIAF